MRQTAVHTDNTPTNQAKKTMMGFPSEVSMPVIVKAKKSKDERLQEPPHVTEILRLAGLVDTTFFTEEARKRGTAVHKATERIDREIGESDFLDDGVRPRVLQYRRFLSEVRPEILEIEKPVHNHMLNYQGRIDRLVRIRGKVGVMDMKPPTRYPWHPIQLSLYAACLPPPIARWGLYLSNENYVLVEYNDRGDWGIAKAAITIAHWRREHGV